MSKCSVKCNELQKKIQNISGLNDQYVYDKLCEIDNIIKDINKYADEDELNGTCFGKNPLGDD